MTHVCDNATWACIPLEEAVGSLCAKLLEDISSSGETPACSPNESDVLVDAFAFVLVVALGLACAALAYKLNKAHQAEVAHATLFDGEENEFQI